MKASVVFTDSGPILVLTTSSALTTPEVVGKLATKGVDRFIAYEVDPELVKKRYGSHFGAILNDATQTDDLRILDFDGHQVFHNFSRSEMGEPVYYGF